MAAMSAAADSWTSARNADRPREAWLDAAEAIRVSLAVCLPVRLGAKLT